MGFQRSLFVLAAVGALFGVWDARRLLAEPLPVTAPVTFEVAQGDNLRKILLSLSGQGSIAADRRLFYARIFGRWAGIAARLKAGEYELKPGTNMFGLMELMTSGRTVLHELAIIEGWHFEQALQAVEDHAAIQRTLAAQSLDDLMAALGRPGLHPEGRILPETYRFPRGTTDVAFLRRAMLAMDGALAEEWAARDLDLPYASADEALVMASIVERETGVVTERPDVAGVFVRRLQKGMRLQTDPTVIYGLGLAFDGNLRKADLLRDGPYNTYTRTGLPPTAICLPGRASLRAALHPAPGTSLYFVARGDGSHHFSATLTEHNEAVRKYQLRRRRS